MRSRLDRTKQSICFRLNQCHSKRKAADIGEGGCGNRWALRYRFWSKLSNGYWLNAGVIGMPANDGQEQTWYMLIDQSPPPNKQTLIQWHRLPYDVAAAQQAMTIAKLPCEYHDALQSGIWPSTDVLPDIETKQQGKARSIPPLLLEPC